MTELSNTAPSANETPAVPPQPSPLSPTPSPTQDTKRTIQTVNRSGNTRLAAILQDAIEVRSSLTGLPVTTRASRQNNTTESTASTTPSYVTTQDGKVLKELRVKFEFPIDSTTQNKSTQDLHLQFIAILSQTFGNEIVIITNRNNKLKEGKLISKDRHKTEYDVHIKKTKNITRHIIIHRIRTSKSLREIKTHQMICPFLEENKIYIKIHQWPESDWDTINLGWKLFSHPTRDFIQELHYELQKYIKDQVSKEDNQDIPQLQLVTSSPSIRHSDTNYTTKAIDFQTLRKHASKVDNLLLNYFKDTSQYVKYSLKHQNASVYAQSIQLQNKYISDFRSITISGLTDEAMHYLHGHVKSGQGIHNIRPANLFQNNGKWQVTTNKDNFYTVHEHLHNTYKEWITHLPSITQHRLTQAHPDGIQVQKIFPKRPRGEDQSISGSTATLQDSYISIHSRSIQTMASVISTATSPAYTSTPKEIQFPNRNLPTWSDVASISCKTNSMHSTSHTTPSTLQPSSTNLQHLEEENNKLKQQVATLQAAQKEVQSLNQKVADLTTQLSALKNLQTENSSEKPSTQYITTDQAAALFSTLMAKHNLSQSTSVHHSPEGPLTQRPSSPIPKSIIPPPKPPKPNPTFKVPPSKPNAPPKSRGRQKHNRTASPETHPNTPSSTQSDPKRRNLQRTPESLATSTSQRTDPEERYSHHDPPRSILDSAEKDCMTGLPQESPLIPPVPMSPKQAPSSVRTTDSEVERQIFAQFPSPTPSPKSPKKLTMRNQDDSSPRASNISKRLFLGEATPTK